MPSNQQLCAECGRQIDTETLSQDFCSECVAKFRSQLTLGFQLKSLWIQTRRFATHLPIITLFLVAVNFATYYLISSNAANSLMLEMERAGRIHGQWWRLVTSTFLHLTLEHLVLNVVFLFFLGWIAEAQFGHLRLLLLWMACGIGGSIAELVILKPNSVALGASGVVYGLIGALFSFYSFRAKVRYTRLQFLRIAFIVLLVGIGLAGDWQVRGKFVPAHIGGLLTGFLTALAIPGAKKNNERLRKSTGQGPD